MSHKCKVDGRVFKTVLALKQHERDVHSNVAPPVAMRKTRKRTSVPTRKVPAMPTQILSGSDLIAVADMAPSVPAGTVLKTVSLTPSGILSTRLAAHAALWARWKPKRLVVKLIGGGSLTTYGLLTVGYTPDTSFLVPATNAEVMQRVTSMQPSATSNVGSTVILNIPCETSRKWYVCRGDADDASHGTLVVAVTSTTGGWSGHLSVNLQVEWTVEFEGADMVAEPTGGSVDSIQPDAGYSHLFTTSYSPFSAEILTFKMHSGGSMVPFSSAKPNYVYTLGTGVKATYVDADGLKKSIPFAVKVQGFEVPGLVFCATRQDAIDYIKSGNDEKLLKYHAAGDWVTPDIPVFDGQPAAAVRLDELASTFSTGTQSVPRTRRELEIMIANLTQQFDESVVRLGGGGRSDTAPLAGSENGYSFLE